MKKFFLLIALCFIAVLQAQEIKVSTKDNDLKLAALPYYSYGKGLGITSADSLFQLNIRFRIQNRIGYIQNEDEDNSIPIFRRTGICPKQRTGLPPLASFRVG